jgi:hypothetical protein
MVRSRRRAARRVFLLLMFIGRANCLLGENCLVELLVG